MLDPTAQVTVGGALLVVIWMLLKYKPWKNSNGKKNSAGERETSFWIGEIARIVEEKMNAHDATRNEDIRRIVREEIGRFDSGQERIIAEIRNLK